MATFRNALLACLLVATAGCGRENTENKVQAYRRQQASDLVADYEEVRSRHDVLATCVKANQVSATYRDAKDTPEAEAWRAKAAEDCRLARDLLAPDMRGDAPLVR